MRAAFEEQRDEIAAAHRRADPLQHGRRAAAPRLPAAAAQPLRRARRAADLRRGDHRLPRRARRRAAARTAYAPTSPAWARSRAAGCRSAVYGGRADIMDVVAPLGPVYQAGTLSGNPLAVAAGLATLKRLDEHAYVTLEGLGRVLEDDLGRAIRRSQRQGPRAAHRLGVHAVLLARGGRRPDQRQAGRAPSSTPSSSTACSTAASCSRPPSSRRPSSRSRTRSRTSTVLHHRRPRSPAAAACASGT